MRSSAATSLRRRSRRRSKAYRPIDAFIFLSTQASTNFAFLSRSARAALSTSDIIQHCSRALVMVSGPSSPFDSAGGSGARVARPAACPRWARGAGAAGSAGAAATCAGSAEGVAACADADAAGVAAAGKTTSDGAVVWHAASRMHESKRVAARSMERNLRIDVLACFAFFGTLANHHLALIEGVSASSTQS